MIYSRIVSIVMTMSYCSVALVFHCALERDGSLCQCGDVSGVLAEKRPILRVVGFGG